MIEKKADPLYGFTATGYGLPNFATRGRRPGQTPYPSFSPIAARAASAPERIAPVKPPMPAKEEAR